MAEALVSVAVEVVGKLLAKVVQQQLSLFAGATRELNELRSTFESIQAVLGDAEARQVGDRRVQLWLSRLRHAAYDIQDLLEDASNHAVSRYNVPGRIKSRYNVAHRIKGIKKRLDQIDAESKRFDFNSSPQGGDQREPARSQRQTASLMDKSEMTFGREKDKEMMINRLVSESSSHEADGSQVHVVAIAGIGGLGKTTLARLVYHDRQVQGHFDEAVYWVCVSDVFDVIRLTKAILEQVKGKNKFPSELDALQKELFEALRGKRFLLVLDDIWNDDDEKWKKLRLPLTSGAIGSRILVTTRSEKVANTMKANCIHELKGLSDDQSWKLFSSRAFAGRREGDYPEFESIGKEIVKNCKGVPLSIKVIGITMNTQRTVEDWKNVLESKMWSLQQVAEKILPALLLTYCHLPPYLKQCFVYCSMFPKDWNFKKDMLIRLWVAQGFILSEGNREKEDIANEYFDELVARSMFQEIEGKKEGNIRCKMHDLLHDLAEFIAKDEIYTFTSNSEGGKSEECSSSSSDVRHAFLSFSGGDYKPDKIPIVGRRAKKLRTLWLSGIDKSDGGVIDLIHEARFLRVLYFSSSSPRLPKSIDKLKHLRYLCLASNIVKLPDAIGKMEQLRYLDLSWNENIVKLPKSVKSLRNLHTLDLSWCRKLKKLPMGIGGMVSLRYLNLSGSNIVELPESASDLRNLHTLDLSDCEKLERLPRGIGGMEQLRYLYLSTSDIVELPESVGDLRNLDILDLSYCEKLKKLPRGIGEMVSLRHLEIERTFSLEYLPKGLGGITGLQSLNRFTVGGGDEGEGCGIDELQPLNSLQGTLEIEHLERVSSGEEAKKAELWKKQYLCSLALKMSGETDDDVIDDNDGGDDDVVVVDDDDDDDDVVVDDGDDDKTRMIDSVLEGMRPHENLEELRLDGCRGSKLPSWMDAMQCLQELVLWDGPMLERVPHLSSLKTFDIHNSRIKILPDEGWERLVALRELQIRCCSELKCLPDSIGQLESLDYLDIRNLKKLESVPDSLGQLRKLKSLSVRCLEVLTSLPDSIGQLEWLDYLNISNLKKLESVPDSLGQLRKLKSLCIGGSEVLTCLPDSIVQLESLECLDIRDCGALASLPQRLRHLSLLQELEIYGCPLLTERCKREGRVDWPNISHIPNIRVNVEWIQRRWNPR